MSVEILKDLWQVGGAGLTDRQDAAVYLLRCGPQAALIDAGCGAAHQALTDRIDQCLGRAATLSHLLLTHCHFDHTGGAEEIRQAYGCQTVAHALDADFLEAGDSETTAASWYGATMRPLTIDTRLHGPHHRLTIGDRTIDAHHLPGHSPGSLVYTASVEGRLVLFGQDVHGPLHPSLQSDAAQYRQSLQKLAELNADLLLEGHYGIIEGKSAVKKFIRSFMTP